MKLWLRLLLGSALALVITASAHAAASVTVSAITASPGSPKPGDNVTYTITLLNSGLATPADDYTSNASEKVALSLHNQTTGQTISYGATAIAVPAIAGAGGTATVQVIKQIPLSTSQAGPCDVTGTLSGGAAGFAGSFNTGTPIVTVVGKPDLKITTITYPAGTAYKGGDVIPMSLTWTNLEATNGVTNVPYVSAANGDASSFRIEVVLSSNPTFGDSDDFLLTVFTVGGVQDANGLNRTINWNQLLPGNFAGTYYVMAKIDTLSGVSESVDNDLTINGNNTWFTETNGARITLLPTNFATVYWASTGGNAYSDNPSITSDGRYTVYASDSTNLVANDTNAVRDIFLFDNQTNTVRRLNLSQQGAQANGASNNPALSGNGRYVAFSSDATNLVLGDTNGFSDIFVVDTITGTISLQSVTGGGVQANGSNFKPAISYTGRYIVFESSATNLVAGNPVGVSQIYLRDRDVSGSGTFDTAGNTATTLISQSTAGTTGNGSSLQAAISAGGKYVTFASDATNLVAAPAVTAGRRHIYLRDLTSTGVTTMVDLTSGGAEANGSSRAPAINRDWNALATPQAAATDDGQFIAFGSEASNLIASDTNGVSDIFVFNRLLPTATAVTRVSVSSTGTEGSDPSAAGFRLGSVNPNINSTGRYVVFSALDQDLTAGDSIGQATAVGLTNIGNGYSAVPTVTITGGGAGVTTTATATATISTDVSIQNIQLTAGGAGYTSSPTVTLTGGGGSNALVRANINSSGAVSDLYVVSAGSGYTSPPIVSFTGGGGAGAAAIVPQGIVTNINITNPGAGYTTTPTVTITGGGGGVTTVATASANIAGGRVAPPDSNASVDIFVTDRDVSNSGTFGTAGNIDTTLVSVNRFGYQTLTLLGTPSTAASDLYPVISGDGRWVAFPSDAENTAGLVHGATNRTSPDLNSFRDVFLHDRRINTLPNSGVAPTVTITNPGSGGSALVNTPISVTASATTTIGVVASVQFFVNGTSLGTSTTFPYSATWTPTAVGTYTLSALVTDSFGNLGGSTNIVVTINAAPSVGITSPVGGSSIIVGTVTTVGATAAASNPGATINTVQFFANGQSLGTVTAPPNSVSFTPTVSWTPAATGNITLTAVALDSIGTQTTSPNVVVTITAASGGGGGGGGSTAPTVSLSPAPPSAAAVNSTVVLTSTATASTGFTLTNVQYFANGVSLGSSAAFPYSVTWTPTALGTYSITAVATDNAGSTTTSAAASVVVSAGTAPTVSLVSPSTGSSYAVGSPIALSATTSLGAGLIASVDFFANNVSIGSKSASTTGQGTAPFFNLEWTPAAAGTYVFTAVVTDTSGNRTTSTSVTVTVTAVAAPVVTITSPTVGTTLTVNTTQTVTVAASPGTGASIASVAIFANNQSLGADTTFPFSASWTPTAPGTYQLRAVATDSFGTQTTSSTVSVTVGSGSSSLPSVYLTSVPAGTSVTANTPVFIAANADDPDGVVTNVEFYANGQLIGSKATAPYATVWVPTAATSYSITAVVTDDAGNRVTSTASTITALVQVGVVPVAGLDFNNPTIDTPTGGAAPAAPALFTPVKVDYGSKLIFSVGAVDQDGSIANVQFFVNGTNIATIGAAPYYTTYTLSTLSDIAVTAIVTDNSGNAIYTTPIIISTQPSDPTGDLVTLVSPVNGATYVTGGQIIFSATHNFGTANPPKIDFYLNGSQFTTVTSSGATGGASSPYQFIIGLTRAGTYDVHAVLRLGNTTTISTPARITVTSNTAPTVSIRSPSNAGSYVIGTALTISANAADPDGTIQNVKFFVNGTALSTATAAPYNASWNPASPGIYTLSASATDDAGNQTISTPVTVTYTGNAAPTVSLSTPSVGARVVAGSPVSLVAAASDADGTVASVRFLANGVVVGTGSTAPYTATWTPSASGIYSVIAQATDNSGNVTSSTAVSVNVLVNQPPVVSLSTPINGAVFRTGASTGLVASATDPDGSVVSVQFLANGNVVGTATAAPYTATWTPSAAGTYTVVAQATDNTGNIASSTTANVTVLANQLPSISLASPTNGSVVRAGSATTLSAAASDSDGSIASVQFFANGVSLGAPITTVTANGYRTQWTPAAEGIFTLSATAIDNSGAAATTTATVLAVSAQTGGDMVYTGTLFGLGEAGKFAVINISGKTAAFIGYSTLGAGKVYFYPGITVDASHGFSLTDATGRVLIAGSVNDTATTITTLDGAPVTLIGIVAFPGGSSVATGYYTGSLSGRPSSQLAAIVGPDGSIMLAAMDGSVRTAGAGAVDSSGTFRNISALGGGVFNGKADPLTNFLSGSLTGPLAGGIMGAVESGVSFSDGFLRNLSSRGQVGTGTNVLVAGFVVGGTTPKQVLVRAIGPSLAQFGVTGILADPQLQLFGGVGGSALVASNNNWGGTAQLFNASNSVGAFQLSPTSLDAIILATLSPGNYTAQVSGVGGATGNALVELYDVDNPTPYSSQKVINISTRAVVGTGVARLIAGFVINGNTAKKVLVRAVGPTLGAAPFNVPGVLADPVLRIIRNSDNMLVRENDSWETGNDATLVGEAGTKAGAFPLAAGSKDAAILISLPPGSYSAEVTGSGTTTGIALVEVYEVP